MPKEKDSEIMQHHNIDEGRKTKTEHVNSHKGSPDKRLSILFTVRTEISPELPFVNKTVLEEVKRMLQKESEVIVFLALIDSFM